MRVVRAPQPLDLFSDRAGTESFLAEVRAAVQSVNSDLPLASVRTMQEVYDKSVAQTSFTLVMLGIAATMALTLGIIGIYGVISHTVSQRKREIGIRLALGAQGGDVLQLVLRQGTKLALVGVAIGIGAALGLTRLMTNLLFGVTAHDPLTFVAVAGLLILVARFRPPGSSLAIKHSTCFSLPLCLCLYHELPLPNPVMEEWPTILPEPLYGR